MQVIGGAEAFDGGDSIALVLHRQAEARVDALTVDQHGTGTALTVVAAFFCSGQLQMFAQGIEQRGPGVEFKLPPLAVDGQSHRADDRRPGGGGAASSAASDDAPGAADIATVVTPPAITWRRVNFIPSSQLGTVTSAFGEPPWLDGRAHTTEGLLCPSAGHRPVKSAKCTNMMQQARRNRLRPATARHS